MRFLPLALALAALVLAPALRAGDLVLIGGGSKPPAVLRHFVRLAGGPDAPLVILPTASGDPDTGRYYVELFRETTGATAVEVLDIRTPLDARRPAWVRALREARGIFFSGGDQSRITRAFLGSPAHRAIRDALDAGAVVGGTSAGTACMSHGMLTGEGDPDVLRASNIELTPGLGLLPRGVVVDQHFVARRRQNRLLSVVLENPGLLGLGVDEATAIWVRPDGRIRVLGEGWVWVYDARDATPRQVGNSLGVRDLRTHVLLPGEEFPLPRARR